MKRRRFEYRGMAVVLAVYLVIALVLFTERAGIQYTEKERSLTYLDKEDVVLAADALSAQKIEALVVMDSTNSDSVSFCEQYRQILKDMKVGSDWVDISAQEIPPLENYRTVTVATSDLYPLADWLDTLSHYVYQGGRGFFPVTINEEETYDNFHEKLGVWSTGKRYEVVKNIYFTEEFVVGGGDVWQFPDGYASAIDIEEIMWEAVVYARNKDENGCPLVWSYDYGDGRFVVDNFGLYEKSMRGFYAASYSLLEDSFAYPVINGSTFYLDDFPSPVPGGDGQYIDALYQMSIDEFYTNVWWQDVMNMGDEYGVVYTGAVIEDYSDDTSGVLRRQEDYGQFHYFGDMLLYKGGEIGYHGYNHQPLNLGSIRYGRVLPYNVWASRDAMKNAMSELVRFVDELYPNTNQSVYVPPSNVLSQEGREMLVADFPHIRTIASNYFGGEMAYEQEFEAAADGIVEQPRTISGMVIDEYMQRTALSELNMHLVNNHFMHPDDLLDEDRGAALGWPELKSRLKGLMDWLYTSVPGLRSLTGSELSGAIQRYGGLVVHREREDMALRLKIDNYIDEAYLLVRLVDKGDVEAVGGEITQLTENLYLLDAHQSDVTISWHWERPSRANWSAAGATASEAAVSEAAVSEAMMNEASLSAATVSESE